MADRALDVCQFEYRGENLTFLSKPGLNGRNQFDTNGLEAQRSIMGGLFFTCGFENICAPYVTPEGGKYPAGSFPMHGRIRTTPAEHVSSDAHWTAEGDYVLEVSGEMREAELFGENLVMRRKITSVYGQPSITVEDEVTNESFRDDQSRKRVPARARRRRERPQLRRRGQPQARTRSRHRLRRQPLPILHGMEVDGCGRLRGRPRTLELQRPRPRLARAARRPATPSTVRPSSTRCCSGRAWRRTARSSATSTMTRP